MVLSFVLCSYGVHVDCEVLNEMCVLFYKGDISKSEDGKDIVDPEESELFLMHMPSIKTVMGGTF